MKFKTGDLVEVNGNKEARVISYTDDGMIQIRLWQGLRHVGDIVTEECDVK